MKYLNKLKADKLLKVLNNSGLFVVDDIRDIKKEADSENADCYYVRAIALDTVKDSVATGSLSHLIKYIQMNDDLKTKNETLYNHINSIMSVDGLSSYSQNNLVDMFTVSDFMLYRTMPIDINYGSFPKESDCNLQKKFFMNMYQIFKEEGYMDSYKEFINSLDDDMDCNM